MQKLFQDNHLYKRQSISSQLKHQKNKIVKKYEFTQSFEKFQFHLDQEQPQSLNAKRKLEQFSEQFNSQKLIDSHKKLNDTVKVLKNLKQSVSQHQQSGWVEQNSKKQQLTRKFSNQKKNKSNQSFCSSKKMREVLKFKSLADPHENQKKYSLDINLGQNRKIHLSLNNLLPAQAIKQNQISKHIFKKARNSRPISSAFNAAARKLLVFQKGNSCDQKSRKRIHSKQSETQQSVPIVTIISTVKNNCLKTSSLGNFYPHLQSSHKIISNDLFQIEKYKNSKEVNSQKHKRSFSQVSNIKQPNNVYDNQISSTFRKSIKLTQKKNKFLNKTVSKSNKLGNISISKNNISDEKSEEQNLKQTSTSLANTQFCQLIRSQDSVPVISHKILKAQLKFSKPLLEAPKSKNFEEDYSLLAKMLKHESQTIVNGQIHYYLTQIKKKPQLQHTYVASTTSNNYFNEKRFKKQSASKMNISDQPVARSKTSYQHTPAHQKGSITRNNTTLHYTSFSSTKHKTQSLSLIGLGGSNEHY